VKNVPYELCAAVACSVIKLRKPNIALLIYSLICNTRWQHCFSFHCFCVSTAVDPRFSHTTIILYNALKVRKSMELERRRRGRCRYANNSRHYSDRVSTEKKNILSLRVSIVGLSRSVRTAIEFRRRRRDVNGARSILSHLYSRLLLLSAEMRDIPTSEKPRVTRFYTPFIRYTVPSA